MDKHDKIIIGICGKKGSGKDSVGSYLQSRVGDDCKVYHFADKLKQDVCINLLGLTEKQCYGSNKDKDGPTHLMWEDMPGNALATRVGPMTGREVMQYWGTEIFRTAYKSIWIDSLMRQIKAENYRVSFIADVRFLNEITAIREQDGVVWKLLRTGIGGDQHESESLIDNYDNQIFDNIIDNRNMTLAEQDAYVWRLYNTIQHEYTKA